jgi:hypothetical protein
VIHLALCGSQITSLPDGTELGIIGIALQQDAGKLSGRLAMVATDGVETLVWVERGTSINTEGGTAVVIDISESGPDQTVTLSWHEKH